MKIIFQTSDEGAWAEIEQADGTMKRWDKELTPEEYVSLCSAGIVLQRGSAAHAILSCGESRLMHLEKLRKTLSKAESIARELIEGRIN